MDLLSKVIEQSLTWRTSIHASLRWPAASEPSMWPMAVDYATHVYNHTPNLKSRQLQMHMFTGTVCPCHSIKDLHERGCPCYVLDPKLQNGQKLLQ
jgi:hypothetical protein